MSIKFLLKCDDRLSGDIIIMKLEKFAAVFKEFSVKTLFGFEKSNAKFLKEKHLVFTDNPHIQSQASLILLRQKYLEMSQNPELIESNKVDLFFFKKNHLNHEGKGQCSYCCDYFHEDELNFDHYIPTYLGGKSYSDNLKISCKKCNSIKGAIHPELMKYTWAIFKNNVFTKQYHSSLALLRSIENSIIFDFLPELEQKLVSKTISKEIEWRKSLVSK